MTIAFEQRPQHALIHHGIERLPSAEIVVQQDKKAVSDASQRSATKAVRFAESHEVREHLHCKDFSASEFIKSWYSRREVPYLKREIAPTLKMVKAGATLPEEYTFRGLEYKTRKGATARRATKAAARSAVLNEQARQRESGQFDDEDIAWVYNLQSEQASLAAQKMGKQDEIELYGER